MKKKIIKSLSVLSLCCLVSIPALASTVTYKGTKVYWDYGRKWGVYSYSDVQSSQYEHGATANGAFSGWEDPGDEAYVDKFIGTATAQCYWNCRG